MSLIAKILPACKWVAEEARFIKINHEKISSYVEFILGRYSIVTDLDPQMHFRSTNQEEMAASVLALDSINFGSGYFPLYPGLEYHVIAGGLKKAFEQGELNTAEQWLRVTPDYLAKIFSIPSAELAALFAAHLRWTGEKITTEYGGKAMNLIAAAEGSAVKLADIVAAWEPFHDVAQYHGHEVPILKRAQILAADLQLALGCFQDLSGLTIFADNMVPHVLRCDGILTYAPELAQKIDHGIFISSGSDEETEIRAIAIYVVELMKQAAIQNGHNVTSVNIDHLLWHRGYEPEIYAKPSHKTLTAMY